MQNRSAGILAAILILIPLYTSGQKLVNSPLARYNLGILEPAGSFRSLGMGGTATAMRNNTTLYYTNPASYSSLDTNSFVFDFGIDYAINLLSDGNDTYLSEDMSFDHILIGFPLSKNWGFVLGLVPMTNGYYNIAETVIEGDPDYDEITGEYISYHGGSGGFASFFFGTGLNITKNLSAGVNMSFLLGSLKRYNEFDFKDYYYTYQTNMTQNFRMGGIGFDFGLQYSTVLKNDYYLTVGTSLTLGKNCKSEYSSITYRYNVYSAPDTLAYVFDDSTRSQLPGSLRAGVAFGKKDKFVVGIDYIYSPWENAEFRYSEGYVTNTQTLLIGAEYTPDRLANYSFLKRMDYRLGGHLGNNYLVFNGEKVNEIGVSMGVGIPMRRTYSKTNFYFDYTRKSLTGQDLIHNENYFTFGLSINLYDVWFLKKKYD